MSRLTGFAANAAVCRMPRGVVKATVLPVKRRFAFRWSDMHRGASRLARCATASAASALTHRGACQPGFASARRHSLRALPWGIGPHDSIQDSEHAPHARNKCDLLGAAAVDQALVVPANDRVPADR